MIAFSQQQRGLTCAHLKDKRTHMYAHRHTHTHPPHAHRQRHLANFLALISSQQRFFPFESGGCVKKYKGISRVWRSDFLVVSGCSTNTHFLFQSADRTEGSWSNGRSQWPVLSGVLRDATQLICQSKIKQNRSHIHFDSECNTKTSGVVVGERLQLLLQYFC